jgi:hypothetical protein
MSTIVVHIAYQGYVLGSMFGLINHVKQCYCLYLQDEIKSAKVSQEDINVSIQAELQV